MSLLVDFKRVYFGARQTEFHEYEGSSEVHKKAYFEKTMPEFQKNLYQNKLIF